MADAPAAPAGPESDADKRCRERVEKRLALPPAIAHGELEAGGKSWKYTSRVEFLPVVATSGPLAGAPQAAVGTTSYLLDSADPRTRPVCFAFNGGPGSASIWLHLGALGPKRVIVPDDGSQSPAPWKLADNPHSWLPHFDLVFVDPPHTGWSLTANEAARKDMLSVDGDARALAEVMRVWLVRHGRFGAPLYLCGESYGTTRGAVIADDLADAGIPLTGLILISCAMDVQALVHTAGHDLPHVVYLPAFAVVSQLHGLLRGDPAASPEAAREAAEAFVPEYLAALHAGARLAPDRRAEVVTRLAELTGLAPSLIDENNLRIDLTTYMFEALRSQGRMIGRLDARATGPMAAQRTRDWEFDPGMESIHGPYATSAMACFAALGVTIEDRYEVLGMDVNSSWGWLRGKAVGPLSFCTTSADLSRAMRRNDHLRVLVASGLYDLATPFSGTEWMLAHLDAPAEVLSRITHKLYAAGHMMYARSDDLAALERDLADWLAEV